ncbi:uncharacterized protein BP5553_10312 [Venustampulla echinocandica]|uniref:Uncharacterized protein n=1 Tax=Venustampulla echinocandica TaxID=2656787 RepID=A0A370T9U2_9HELO|nr:uncharacterized protein BP5553_10312 [Venustampulla echinocandica]RDL30434.1 hypothetical protein BP5553_10312 [Venustampulla echinocandica]
MEDIQPGKNTVQAPTPAENGYELYQIAPAIKPSPSLILNSLNIPYFWGEGYDPRISPTFSLHSGYTEARHLIGDGSLESLESLTTTALQYINRVFNDISSSSEATTFISPSLSPSLLKWKETQHALGNILPSKGDGIKRASPSALRILNVESWPEPLLTNGSLFGCGMANMLIGAYDSRVLFSNYCVDMIFYYEHGYQKVFPLFEDLVKNELANPHAIASPAGYERRKAAEIGMRYIKRKIEL